jgi:hypothetical protein
MAYSARVKIVREVPRRSIMELDVVSFQRIRKMISKVPGATM